MSQLIELQFVAAILAATLASIAVWSPRKPWIKGAAVALSIAFMPVAYAGMADLLSKPKPVRLEWAQAKTETATVLGAQIRENEAIYLWLQIDAGEPRYYKIPWDQETAKDLQKAMQEADKNKSGLEMTMPFEPSYDLDKPKFYALPQPSMPEKGGEGGGGPDEGPMEYRHPGVSA